MAYHKFNSFCFVFFYSEKWVLGRVNKTLEYFDGVVKLTYLDGTPYHVQEGAEEVKRRVRSEKSDNFAFYVPEQDTLHQWRVCTAAILEASAFVPQGMHKGGFHMEQ